MTIPELHSHFLKSNGFSTDTRTLKKGALFFCLKGENFNGNVFAQKAIEAGASFVIFDDLDYQPKAENAIQLTIVSPAYKHWLAIIENNLIFQSLV